MQKKFKLLASQHCKAAPHPGPYRSHTGLRLNHTHPSPDKMYQPRNGLFSLGILTENSLRWKQNETVMTLSNRPLILAIPLHY
jgi:hypothetical protein